MFRYFFAQFVFKVTLLHFGGSLQVFNRSLQSEYLFISQAEKFIFLRNGCFENRARFIVNSLLSRALLLFSFTFRIFFFFFFRIVRIVFVSSLFVESYVLLEHSYLLVDDVV